MIPELYYRYKELLKVCQRENEIISKLAEDVDEINHLTYQSLREKWFHQLSVELAELAMQGTSEISEKNEIEIACLLQEIQKLEKQNEKLKGEYIEGSDKINELLIQILEGLSAVEVKNHKVKLFQQHREEEQERVEKLSNCCK